MKIVILYNLLIILCISKHQIYGKYFHVEEPVNLILLGDWGGKNSEPYTTVSQLEVAKQMELYHEKNNILFVLGLGDNFYPSGVTSIYDKRFEKTYHNVYFKNNMKNIPWYLILGNHDHRLNNSRHQIDFANVFHLWNLPDYFYDINIIIKSKNKFKIKNKKAKFIMIDTTLLCNLFDDMPKLDVVNKNYYNWIKHKLDESLMFDYVFVVGHHPIISQISARSGSKCLNNDINSLLIDYNITSYISGHDHNLQHNTYFNSKSNQTINYFVSGVGAHTDKRMKRNITHKNFDGIFYWNDLHIKGGFLTLSLNSENYEFNFIDAKGNNLHSGIVNSYLKKSEDFIKNEDQENNANKNIRSNSFFLIIIYGCLMIYK